MNPLCPTNDDFEDMLYYFLFCNSYVANRCDLLNIMHAILLPRVFINLSIEKLLKVILYDDINLPFDSQAKILAEIYPGLKTI